jgi:hypothetical protein
VSAGQLRRIFRYADNSAFAPPSESDVTASEQHQTQPALSHLGIALSVWRARQCLAVVVQRVSIPNRLKSALKNVFTESKAPLP